MKHLSLWLLAALSIGWAVSTHACSEPVVERQRYYSGWLQQNMFYTVVLPPCYDPAQTYPTVYLKHGSNDDDGQWVRLGLPEELQRGVELGRLPQMIIVLPFGNNIANRNWFEDVSWSNVFLTEMLPDVWEKYPSVSRDPQQVAIGGISRGGFWAYQVGLRRPDLFGSIGGHSAFFDRFHAPAQHNPLDLVLSEPNVPQQRLWLDRGRFDYAAPGLDIMDQRMAQRGLTYTYMIYPEGEHNNTYWRAHVADYLAFYAEGFRTAQSAPPPPPPISAFATNTPFAPIPTSTPQAVTANQSVGSAVNRYDLFVPVVAFPSLRTTLTSEEMAALLAGRPPFRVVMDPTTQATLFMNGIVFENVDVVDAAQIDGLLWRDYRTVAIVPFDQLTLRLRALWLDDMPIYHRLASFPLAFPNPEGAFDPAKLGRVTVSGVTALTRRTIGAIDANGVEQAASGIRDYVLLSDLFHISNEVSFTDECPRATRPILGGFCSKKEHFELFNLLNVGLVELSGNHNNDFGFAAYEDTLNWYRERGMATVGGGMDILEAQAPFIREINGTTIGWIACNDVGPYYALVTNRSFGREQPGAAPCDRAWLRDVLPALRQQVDVLIVTVQQLEVEDYQPPAAQRAFFQLLIDLGADFVAGTAAHKPQTFQFYGGKLIHHGLGNLFFDQPFWGNRRFFMDTLLLYDGKLMGIELFVGIIDDLYRPRLMTPEERENFMFFMLRQQNGF
ncbi:MAG: CapA family protein [Anaerolinea sp.]